MDETSEKIIDAAMELIAENGYPATTTKNIAKRARVNECTLFRKFKGKKDIVLQGINQEKWRGNVTPAIFKNISWDLKTDLKMFMTNYMKHITPDFVKLSIGLRDPEIYPETAPIIMKIPEAFLSSLISYFSDMEKRGKLAAVNFEGIAMTVFSATFGFTFLSASFNTELSTISKEDYIEQTIVALISGIKQP